MLWSLGLRAHCFDTPLTEDLVEQALKLPEMGRLDWVDLHGIVHEADEREIKAPWLPFLKDWIASREDPTTQASSMDESDQ